MSLTSLGTGCGAEAEAAGSTEAAAGSPVEPAHYDPRQSLAPMIKAVSPAVVTVDARRPGRAPGWLRGDAEVEGMGSGFIIDASGLVVTNHHVTDGAQSVRVRLSDGQRFDAEVVGSDPATDLALLRLSGASSLLVVTLGRSDTLEVGDWVVAVGNPMGLDHSATVGIVSGKGRGSLGLYRDSYIDFLQTDADIAPGSSGGPLFNLRGEVIGINTAVGASLRPGFAIPIDQAKRVVEQLRDGGQVQRGWLGAANAPGDDEPGARIGSVYVGTPAERAGLRAGDVVESIDGQPLESFEELRARVGTKQPGEEVELGVRRGGESLVLRVTLGARPVASSLDALRPSRAEDRPAAGSGGPDRSQKLPFGLKWPSAPPSAADEPRRLGVSARPTAEGLEVVEVREGSLAQTLGLAPGDTLRELNGRALRQPADVASALADAGSAIELRFERDGAAHIVTLDE